MPYVGLPGPLRRCVNIAVEIVDETRILVCLYVCNCITNLQFYNLSFIPSLKFLVLCIVTRVTEITCIPSDELAR